MVWAVLQGIILSSTHSNSLGGVSCMHCSFCQPDLLHWLSHPCKEDSELPICKRRPVEVTGGLLSTAHGNLSSSFRVSLWSCVDQSPLKLSDVGVPRYLRHLPQPAHRMLHLNHSGLHLQGARMPLTYWEQAISHKLQADSQLETVPL